MNRKPNRLSLIALLALLTATFATSYLQDRTPKAPSLSEAPPAKHRAMLEVGDLTEGEPEPTEPKAAAGVMPDSEKVSAATKEASVRF